MYISSHSLIGLVVTTDARDEDTKEPFHKTRAFIPIDEKYIGSLRSIELHLNPYEVGHICDYGELQPISVVDTNTSTIEVTVECQNLILIAVTYNGHDFKKASTDIINIVLDWANQPIDFNASYMCLEILCGINFFKPITRQNLNREGEEHALSVE